MIAKQTRRRALLALGGAAAALAAAAVPASAQSWPTRPITLIVSQPAGNSPDVMARLLAEGVSAELKSTMLVENRPGGANVTGTLAVTRAAPDGYTFLFGTTASLVSNVFLLKNLAYDPMKDLVPVAFIVRSSQILVVNPKLPVKTLADLVALDKKSPGKLSIAVDGPRALAGIAAQALNVRTGMTLTPVPYPKLADGIRDVIAGRLDVGIFSQSLIENMDREGQLRAIAGSAATRPVAMKHVAPISDTIPGFDFAGWFMVMAPAKTPPEIVARMNAAINAALKGGKVRETIPKIGFETNEGSANTLADAAKFLASQMEFWRKTTQDLKMEPL